MIKKKFKNCPIKIFNLNGDLVDNLKNSCIPVTSIDIYYDKNLSTKYIIVGTRGGTISYDYNTKNAYKIYEEHDWIDWFHGDKDNNYSNLIYDKDKYIKLISSFEYGIIKIWNFHKGNILNKIRLIHHEFYGICIFDNKYLCTGGKDGIEIIDFKKGLFIKTISNNNNKIKAVKNIMHPTFGECLITGDINNIILWKN